MGLQPGVPDLAAEPVDARRHDAGPGQRRFRLRAHRRRRGYSLRVHLATGKDWVLSRSSSRRRTGGAARAAGPRGARHEHQRPPASKKRRPSPVYQTEGRERLHGRATACAHRSHRSAADNGSGAGPLRLRSLVSGSGVRREGRPCLPAPRGPRRSTPASSPPPWRGDDEAFIDVMRHYDRRLRIVAYHVLGDRQLDGRRPAGSHAQGLPLAAPAFAATRRSAPGCAASPTGRAATPSRRADRLYPLPPDDLPEPPDCEPDPADAWPTRRRWHDAFAALPPEQRLAVLLVDREGYDYATTAEILGVPDGHAGLAPVHGTSDAAPPPGPVARAARCSDGRDPRQRSLGAELQSPAPSPTTGRTTGTRCASRWPAGAERPPGRPRAGACAPPSARGGCASRVAAAALAAVAAAAVLFGLPRAPAPRP